MYHAPSRHYLVWAHQPLRDKISGKADKIEVIYDEESATKFDDLK